MRGFLGFAPGDINCLLVLPQGKGFDVSFKSVELLRVFWEKFEGVKDKFGLFNVERLTDESVKVVFVRMYNELVSAWDVERWLERFCVVRSFASKVLDVDGIWTGGWRVPIKLQVDPAGYGGFRHLPSSIVLGENRGVVYYAGQPKLCRRCGAYGHLVEGCKAIVCLRCREVGHEAPECPTGRKCNLCGSPGHIYRNCPDSFANRARGGAAGSSNQGEGGAQGSQEGEERSGEEQGKEQEGEGVAQKGEGAARESEEAPAGGGEEQGVQEAAQEKEGAEVSKNEEVSEKGNVERSAEGEHGVREEEECRVNEKVREDGGGAAAGSTELFSEEKAGGRVHTISDSESESGSMVTVGSGEEEGMEATDAGAQKRAAEEELGSMEVSSEKKGRKGFRERWGLLGVQSDSDSGESSPSFPQLAPNEWPYLGEASAPSGDSQEEGAERGGGFAPRKTLKLL